MKTTTRSILLGSALAATLTLSGNAMAPAAEANDPKAKAALASGPTDKAIAVAKARGLVWVDTSSKVYYKDGEFYGRTNQGEFMPEAAAQEEGYHSAKAPAPSKKKSADKNK